MTLVDSKQKQTDILNIFLKILQLRTTSCNLHQTVNLKINPPLWFVKNKAEV
ncbi:hypothetical protein HanRHA438_Chr06g0270731 [Helianthus annuus]|nr:hypothetical protein HanRHA438_Chr06g0270731 [Helianthus annuus]